MRNRFRLVVIAAAAAMGCRGSAGSSFTSVAVLAPSSESEAAHDELLRADISRADTAMRLGLAKGLTAVLTEDVVYLRGGLPILRGRAVARSVLAADSALSGASVRWQPVRAEVSRDRKNGYSYGFAIYATNERGASAIRIDRYIAFWRMEGRQWKVSAYAETYASAPAAIALPAEASSGVLADVMMSPRGGVLDMIREADTQFSRAATKFGSGEAFGRYAASDAQMFSGPGEFITGPDAISESFGPVSAKSSLVWHPVEGEMASSGDLGYTVGNAVFTDEQDGGSPTVRYSKYLTVWKRQRDGTWKYVVDGGSDRPKS